MDELIDPSLLAMDHAAGETPSPDVSSSQSNDPVDSLLVGGRGGSADAKGRHLVGEDRGEQDKQADVWSGPIGGVSSTPVQAVDSSFSSHTARSSTSAPLRTKSELSASEDLNEELANLLLSNQLPQTAVSSLQNLLRENASLKEKNGKLKSLLGRSAKAQRDAKNELEQMKKMYEVCKADNDRLEKRVEVLANRPTHMDLLADFETNFDRAMLSIGGSEKKSQQSGGEDAAESSLSEPSMPLYDESPYGGNFNRVSGGDSLLLTELNEAKARIGHLESMNNAFQSQYHSLEHTHKSLLHEQQSVKNSLTNCQLELRMSKMETEHALRTIREKDAIVREMQLEINLVTQSAVDANRRAAEGLKVASQVKEDKEYVAGLEAKVVALQEWALASTESKRLTTDRCRGLEARVEELEGVVKKITSGDVEFKRLCSDGSLGADIAESVKSIASHKSAGLSGATSLASGNDNERILWTKSSSLVVGAGMVGQAQIELGQVQIEAYETVILRYKIDLTASDLDCYFSVLKGLVDDNPKTRRVADACFRGRHVQGGGGGDVTGAFAKQNACTLVWSNERSWVRP